MISEQKLVSQEVRSASFRKLQIRILRNGFSCVDRHVFNLFVYIPERFSLNIPRHKLNRDVYDLLVNIRGCFSLILPAAMGKEYFRKAFKNVKSFTV